MFSFLFKMAVVLRMCTFWALAFMEFVGFRFWEIERNLVLGNDIYLRFISLSKVLLNLNWKFKSKNVLFRCNSLRYFVMAPKLID